MGFRRCFCCLCASEFVFESSFGRPKLINHVGIAARLHIEERITSGIFLRRRRLETTHEFLTGRIDIGLHRVLCDASSKCLKFASGLCRVFFRLRRFGCTGLGLAASLGKRCLLSTDVFVQRVERGENLRLRSFEGIDLRSHLGLFGTNVGPLRSGIGSDRTGIDRRTNGHPSGSEQCQRRHRERGEPTSSPSHTVLLRTSGGCGGHGSSSDHVNDVIVEGPVSARGPLTLLQAPRDWSTPVEKLVELSGDQGGPSCGNCCGQVRQVHC